MTTKRITVPFEITGWDQTTWDETAGVLSARAEVKKTFSGDLVGSSTAQVLTVMAGESGLAYSAQEVFTGELEGRSGSFVMVHGAADGDGGDPDDPHASGIIISGSGRGELTGITGTVEIRHDENGARFGIAYTLA